MQRGKILFILFILIFSLIASYNPVKGQSTENCIFPADSLAVSIARSNSDTPAYIYIFTELNLNDFPEDPNVNIEKFRKDFVLPKLDEFGGPYIITPVTIREGNTIFFNYQGQEHSLNILPEDFLECTGRNLEDIANIEGKEARNLRTFPPLPSNT